MIGLGTKTPNVVNFQEIITITITNLFYYYHYNFVFQVCQKIKVNWALMPWV